MQLKLFHGRLVASPQIVARTRTLHGQVVLTLESFLALKNRVMTLLVRLLFRTFGLGELFALEDEFVVLESDL